MIRWVNNIENMQCESIESEMIEKVVKTISHIFAGKYGVSIIDTNYYFRSQTEFGDKRYGVTIVGGIMDHPTMMFRFEITMDYSRYSKELMVEWDENYLQSFPESGHTPIDAHKDIASSDDNHIPDYFIASSTARLAKIREKLEQKKKQQRKSSSSVLSMFAKMGEIVDSIDKMESKILGVLKNNEGVEIKFLSRDEEQYNMKTTLYTLNIECSKGDAKYVIHTKFVSRYYKAVPYFELRWNGDYIVEEV